MQMVEFIIQDISDTFIYLRYSLIAAICISFILMMSRLWVNHLQVNHLRAKRDWQEPLVRLRWNWAFFVKWLVFLTYLMVLVQVALLSREPGSRTTTDLIPFSTFGTTAKSIAFEIENVLMFLPMGLLLPMLYKNFQSFRWIFPALLVLSVAIEVTQYLTQRGFMQTEDVLMNVLGGICGFGVWKGVDVVRAAVSSKKNLKNL